MYRKKLQELQKMEDQQQVLTRVANYPIVKDTWNKVTEVYRKGKENSRLVRLCGNLAETGVSLAYMTTVPIIEKLPLPVESVNDYAVKKLEILEEKYPVLVKPTEEVFQDAVNYGTDQFNRLAEVARLNTVLNIADVVVDKFLPAPALDEPSESTPLPVSEAPVASTRLRVLSDKVKRRAYENAMAKVGGMQQRSQEAIAKLCYTVDLIDYAKQNIQNVKFDDVQEKVKSLYGEITADVDGEETLPADASLEKKTIYVARTLTKRARAVFSTVSHISYLLPTHARTAVNEAYKYAENMHEIFLRSTSFADFSGQVLADLRQRLSFLENTAGDLVKYVSESRPLRWLASNGPSLTGTPESISSSTPQESLKNSQGDEPQKTDDSLVLQNSAFIDSQNVTIDELNVSIADNSYENQENHDPQNSFSSGNDALAGEVVDSEDRHVDFKSVPNSSFIESGDDEVENAYDHEPQIADDRLLLQNSAISDSQNDMCSRVETSEVVESVDDNDDENDDID